MEHAEMVREAAKRLKKRYAEVEKRSAERRVRAQEFARALAPGIAATAPDVVRIIGFGSTFETWRPYRMDSDIDLGITGGDWFEAMRAVPESEFDVSIVPLDLQNPEFHDHVIARGTVLYERQ